MAGGRSSWPQRPGAPSETTNWWWNVVILLLAIGGVYVVFHFRPFRFSIGTAHPLVGSPLPPIKLELVESAAPEGLQLEDLQGQVVVICFWGPWSDLSRKAVPELVELSARYRKRPDFRLVLIACPERLGVAKEELSQQVQTALGGWSLSVPVYIDPDGETLARFQAVKGLERLPSVYLVDRGGKIVALWPGYREGIKKELQELLEELLPSN